MEDVKRAFPDIAPKLNLSESPPMRNLQSVSEVRKYLMGSHFWFCVLVINADQIKCDRGHHSEERWDYRQLLETVVNRVGKIRQILIRSAIPSR